MRIMNVALASCLSLSVLSSAIGVPQRAEAQNQEPTLEFTGRNRSITKGDLDSFCEEQAGVSLSSATQPNGEQPSPAVIQLAPGRYTHPDMAALLLYPDGRYFVRPPLSE